MSRWRPRPAQAGVTADSAAAGSLAGLDDGFSPRMPTGPLASRSAGPIVPALAVVDSDPTPAVDRHELALLQDLDETTGEAVAGSVESPGRNRFAGLELAPASDDTGEPLPTQAFRSAGSAEPVVAVRGGGGLPLKVTGLGRGSHTDSAALLAVMPLASNTTSEPSVAASEFVLPAAVEPPARMETIAAGRLECPDFVKAAIGLALGLGLAAGPLFSDLIIAMPARGARRFQTLWSRARGLGSPARRPRLRWWFHRGS